MPGVLSALGLFSASPARCVAGPEGAVPRSTWGQSRVERWTGLWRATARTPLDRAPRANRPPLRCRGAKISAPGAKRGAMRGSADGASPSMLLASRSRKSVIRLSTPSNSAAALRSLPVCQLLSSHKRSLSYALRPEASGPAYSARSRRNRLFQR